MKTIKNAAVIFAFVLILLSCADNEKVIGLKENIHHDDFEYSVQKVEKTEWIENLKAKGMFYLVTFRLENRAKRVEHKWDNNTAYIIDENGNKFENMYEMQLNLKRTIDFGLKEHYITAAGQSEETILVFDIPNNVRNPYLKVSGDFFMGDLFDGNQFKNTKIKLF